MKCKFNYFSRVAGEVLVWISHFYTFHNIIVDYYLFYIAVLFLAGLKPHQSIQQQYGQQSCYALGENNNCQNILLAPSVVEMLKI